MTWQQLKIQTTAEYAESIHAFLDLLDAVAIAYEDAADQPLLEPAPNTTPLWDHVIIKSLFKPGIDLQHVINFLQKNLGEAVLSNYQIETLPDQAWERVWLKDFHPMQFGNHLWICPSVMTPPDPNAINIILDPGLAFGTGTHPTTALCLEWLDANPPANQIVIDYGCGSGILAIAALKLGAREVWAIDHDPQALEATYINAERNQVDLTKLRIFLPEEIAAIEADLLIANILTNPLIELANKFAHLIKEKGNVVLTGILEDQTEMIKQAYQSWLTIKDITKKEEWIRVHGIKKEKVLI